MTDDEWREKVRALLKAISNVELIRGERIGRYGWDAYWARLNRAIDREKEIRKELGL